MRLIKLSKKEKGVNLSPWDKKRIHNLKYLTWVEQLGKDVDEMDCQWSDEDYLSKRCFSYKKWDELIRGFNEKTGLLEKYL